MKSTTEEYNRILTRKTTRSNKNCCIEAVMVNCSIEHLAIVTFSSKINTVKLNMKPHELYWWLECLNRHIQIQSVGTKAFLTVAA